MTAALSEESAKQVQANHSLQIWMLLFLVESSRIPRLPPLQTNKHKQHISQSPPSKSRPYINPRTEFKLAVLIYRCVHKEGGKNTMSQGISAPSNTSSIPSSQTKSCCSGSLGQPIQTTLGNFLLFSSASTTEQNTWPPEDFWKTNLN